MTPYIINEIKTNCEILLNRSLLNKQVSAFGSDGHGRHGQSEFAKYFTISNITVMVSVNKEYDLMCTVMLELAGFDESDAGHVSTDNNLSISINKLFKEYSIDSSCWEYAGYDYQGPNFVMLIVDAMKLVD